MKKISYYIFALISILGCSKPSEPSCPTPEISVAVSGTSATVNITKNPKYIYQIEYGKTGFGLGSGYGFPEEFNSNSFTINDIYKGTTDIYIRGNCDGSEWSEWSSVKSFYSTEGASQSCEIPWGTSTDINLTLNWYDVNADYYEVEYGLTGFVLGTGTRVRSNNDYYDGGVFQKGKTYDFYVRSNCGTQEWSRWSKVSSFYADADKNYSSTVCNAPTNVTAYQTGAKEISFEFDSNGGTSYQISFSTSNSSYGTITDYYATSGTFGFSGIIPSTYYFWVRARCSTGSYTSWVVTQVF